MNVLYEEHQGIDGICLVPMKLIVRFARGKMLWDKAAVYLPLDSPFRRQYPEDFCEDVMSITILLDDIIMSFLKPNHVGISLTHVMERMEKLKERDMLTFHYEDIEQFIIQIDDIEQVLRLEIRSLFLIHKIEN
ncbi:hypothetical protein [Paenibacillus sp. RC67]|uniref:hypothetical protein n=1 Tax=Paenibacillus sp. RC67 TaxID=3039392 RepID=UPI0024AD24C6|nr:hypothetical protein [Paenibacillus sp. RC67]